MCAWNTMLVIYISVENHLFMIFSQNICQEESIHIISIQYVNFVSIYTRKYLFSSTSSEFSFHAILKFEQN